MKGRKFSELLAYAGMVLLMIAANIFAVLLINPMQSAGLFAFENPDSVGNVIFFIFLMLVFTAILLLLIRKKARSVISAIIALSLAAVIYYVVFTLICPFVPEFAAYVISIVIGIGGILLLVFYPEWFIIDAVGIITSAGCAAIFGISLSPIPVIVLLILLIVYDYVAVHKTKHMLTLADGVMQQKMPIMFLVPKTLKYSYRRDGLSTKGDKSERSAYMIGMGDNDYAWNSCRLRTGLCRGVVCSWNHSSGSWSSSRFCCRFNPSLNSDEVRKTTAWTSYD